MEIRKYWCDNCKKEHIVKIYENKSEALADVFMENAFPDIFNNLKEKQKELSIEEFCKELVETSVYNFHKHMKRLKVPKGSIKKKEAGENIADE
jgi:hypothetical protein